MNLKSLSERLRKIKIGNPVKSWFYHLYILQIEEYNLKRYIQFITKTKGVPDSKPRKKIIWTQKVSLLFGVSIIIELILSIKIISLVDLGPLFIVLPFFLFMYVSYIFLILSLVLIWPLDFYLKKKIISDAKKKLSLHKNLTIIGIAGSYGKTTMKEVVSGILLQKFSVLKTPENINTPIGIARLISKDLDEKIEILVIEMGEYEKGDIKEICELTPPNIAIVTGINEAHLERMGSLEITTKAIFEIVEYMDPAGLVILNGDNERIVSVYQSYIKNQKAFLYHAHNKMKASLPLLGEYAKGTVQGAAAVASFLGVDEKDIEKGVNLLQPLPHRLQPIKGQNGTLVIDDSYNGNPDGVREAIKVLSTYTDRRKIYITPGLVEGGERTRDIHYNIGKQLAPVADKVILIKNSATPFIEQGLIENGFNKTDIIWFDKTAEAHAAIGTIVKPNDVVLFQNDWPDNYL